MCSRKRPGQWTRNKYDMSTACMFRHFFCLIKDVPVFLVFDHICFGIFWCSITCVRCLRSVCLALDSQIKKKFFVCLGRREERWPQMVSTPGDFCAHACVHGGQPTVLFRVSASLSQNAWICAPRATDRDLESVSASF